MSAMITLERPDSLEAQALIEELEGELAPLYPSESRHGYSVERLLTEVVAFFLIRQDGVPAGCGGVKLVGTEYGEVKRMYVRPQFRGLGLAKKMLNHLADYAQSQGVGVLRLMLSHRHPASSPPACRQSQVISRSKRDSAILSVWSMPVWGSRLH